jgi:hypothetical protein
MFFHTTDTGGELRAEQTGLGGFICQSPDRSQPYVDCAWSQISRLHVNSIPQYDVPYTCD